MKPLKGWRWLKKGETINLGDKQRIDIGFGPLFVSVRANLIGCKINAGQFIRKPSKP
jgi:hypothetical protein